MQHESKGRQACPDAVRENEGSFEHDDGSIRNEKELKLRVACSGRRLRDGNSPRLNPLRAKAIGSPEGSWKRSPSSGGSQLGMLFRFDPL